MGTQAEQPHGEEQEQEHAAPQEQPQEETRAVGVLTPEIRQQIELRRQISAVASKIAGLNWGKALDVQTRMAVAHWADRHGIDATTEIDVLGGRPYLNARFYLNRLAIMVEDGKIDYAFCDHITADKRLLDIDTPESRKEWNRRAMLRIEYGAPEDAKAIVVARIKLHNTPVEFTGVKWTGTGRKAKKGGVVQNYNADDVGEDFPQETAETRALRRACRLLINAVPEARTLLDRALDDAALNINERIEQAVSNTKATAIAEAAARHPRFITGSSYDDQPLQDAKTQGATVDIKKVDDRVLRTAAAQQDPYDDDAPPVRVKGEKTPKKEAAPEPEYQDDSALAKD